MFYSTTHIAPLNKISMKIWKFAMLHRFVFFEERHSRQLGLISDTGFWLLGSCYKWGLFALHFFPKKFFSCCKGESLSVLLSYYNGVFFSVLQRRYSFRITKIKFFSCCKGASLFVLQCRTAWASACRCRAQFDEPAWWRGPPPPARPIPPSTST